MKGNGAGLPGICPRECDLFLGLDVDKRSVADTVVDHDFTGRPALLPASLSDRFPT